MWRVKATFHISGSLQGRLFRSFRTGLSRLYEDTNGLGLRCFVILELSRTEPGTQPRTGVAIQGSPAQNTYASSACVE